MVLIGLESMYKLIYPFVVSLSNQTNDIFNVSSYPSTGSGRTGVNFYYRSSLI